MERISVKLMELRKRFCLTISVALLALAVGGQAYGQTDIGTLTKDFSTLKGDGKRGGRNGDPLGNTSGLSYLTWFFPNTSALTAVLTLDNTDYASSLQPTYAINPDTGLYDGLYDVSLYGYVQYGTMTDSTANANYTGWTAPKLIDEANGSYLVQKRKYYANTSAGVVSPDFATRAPGYMFTSCVPSHANDVTKSVNETLAPVKYFQWTVQPEKGSERFYEIFVNLPVGATSTTSGRLFPQRYFVLQVFYGTNSVDTQVVDTYTSGSGFVRLGNNGSATNKVYRFDGKTPIKVRLYNTVPRDANGHLTTDSSGVDQSVNYEINNASKYCVYADAVQLAPISGTFLASPTTAALGTTDFRVAAALNEYSSVIKSGIETTTTTGRVYNFAQSSATPVWKYAPIENSDQTRQIDDTSVTRVGSWTNSTTPSKFLGSNYSLTPIISGSTPTATATYAPALNDGSYEVYAYIPGQTSPDNFGTAVRYDIYEDGNIVYTGYLNQAILQGWAKLGIRRYVNSNNLTTGASTLKVVFSNISSSTSDVGKYLYSDAVRFVGASDTTISSTPVHALIKLQRSSGGSPVDTRVVIVADESGVIHCLDETGNSDGTTTEYWSYPSTKPAGTTATNWDPNQVSTLDGDGPAAVMPTRFDLSTAVVRTINDISYLWIASTNGRVYCINMAGRGDYVAGSKVGTTTRRWTYPDDFPSVKKTDTIGATRGSLVFGDASDGATGPTIYVPAYEGRIYALDALGNDTTKQTTLKWAFPLTTSSNLPPIAMTPSLEFGNLYFGTLKNPNTDGPGQFYAISAASGSVTWTLNSTTNPEITETFDDFLCGPATVPGTVLDSVTNASPNTNLASNPDTVYIFNQNRYLYGVNASTGRLVFDGFGQHAYRTNELSDVSGANLGFTVIKTYDRNSTLANFPIIMVPTTSGRMVGLFARSGEFNKYTNLTDTTGSATYRYAYGMTLRGADATSLSFSNGWMYGADADGFLYAISNTQGNWGNGVSAPGTQEVPPNDPRGTVYRLAKIGVVKQTTYQKLRQAAPNNYAYYDVITALDVVNSTLGLTKNPLAFEWGETAYILVYDFPFQITTANNTVSNPPQINIQISVDGKVVRSIPVDSRQFNNSTSAPLLASLPGVSAADAAAMPTDARADGYAVLPFTFEAGGPNALPPGNAEISITMSTNALNTNGRLEEVILDPSKSKKPFYMANPLGIVVPQPNGQFLTNLAYQLGAWAGGSATDPTSAENLINGSQNVNGYYQSQMVVPSTTGQHGQSTGSQFYVFDRSLMAYIRPPGPALSGVRVERNDLAWQGGANSIYKPLPSSLYPGFEDLPTRYPNNSLDYPNIAREAVRFTKDPLTSAENPLLTGVSLNPPTTSSGAYLTNDTTDPNYIDPLNRVLNRTTFQIGIDLPRFQPPVNTSQLASNLLSQDDSTNLLQVKHDSAGNIIPVQGYFGRGHVFVDSTGTGKMSLTSRQAYRSFNMTTNVAPDERIVIGTPTLDLGSLASGSGYISSSSFVPGLPWTNGGTLSDFGYNPWTLGSADQNSRPGNFFQPIEVRNEGNVNLLHLRLAKVDAVNYSAGVPWQFNSVANDPYAFLDATFDLHSNVDSQYAPIIGGSSRQVILQKPQVTDRAASVLSVNAIRRANANNNVSEGLANPAYPSGPAKISVSIPIGFPVGSYSSNLIMIEEHHAGDPWGTTFNNSDDNAIWQPLTATSVETYSNPIKVSFNVRETRMTSNVTQGSAPIIDASGYSLLPSGAVNPAPYVNLQPTAMRTQTGSLVVAWTSNRPDFSTKKTDDIPPLDNPYRIYVNQLQNSSTFNSSGISTPFGSAPLRDLNFFNPVDPQRWFSSRVAAYPTVTTQGEADALFPDPANNQTLLNTVKFGSPALPATGDHDPFDSNEVSGRRGTTYMAFVGDAQKQTASGRLGQSRIFITPVQSGGANVTLGTPIPVPDNTETTKSKPAVGLIPVGALTVYGATSGNASSLYYSVFDGSNWVDLSGGGSTTTGLYSYPLSLGEGFQSAVNPSLTMRYYTGAAYSNINSGDRIADLTFVGKLKGMSTSQVFMARMKLDQSTGMPNSTAPFSFFPQQTMEQVTFEGSGLYRTRGVAWDLTGTNPIDIQVFVGTSTQASLITSGTMRIDRETGLVTGDSVFGGRVVIDPKLGTVRLLNGAPPKNALIKVTYKPGFIRVSAGGPASYTSVSSMFDQRYLSEVNYWFFASGGPVLPTSQVHNDRYVYMMGRAAAGTGQTARPFMSTMRLGVRLPYPVLTTANGGVVSLNVQLVSGSALNAYQINPARGQVYFTKEDEGKIVNITYTYNDGSGNGSKTYTTGDVPISFVLETSEAAIPIEQAVNESNLSAFLDPFSYATTNSANNLRPPLMWLFYTSTRAGGSDLYFQTIAPRLGAFPLGN